MTLATDATPATEGPDARSSRRRGGWQGWAVSILVAVLLGAGALVYLWWHGRPADYEHTKANTVTYPLADKLTIEVTDGADVVLRAGVDQTAVQTMQEWDGETVPASETGYSTAPDGGTLSLSGGCRSIACLVTFTVHVPLDTEVTLTSAGGDITLADMTGNVSVTNTTGDLKLDGSRVSSLTVKINEGDVTGSLAAVPALLSIDVAKGDVDLELARADYAVTATVNGDSKVTVQQVTGATNVVQITLGAGDLKLRPNPRG